MTSLVFNAIPFITLAIALVISAILFSRSKGLAIFALIWFGTAFGLAQAPDYPHLAGLDPEKLRTMVQSSFMFIPVGLYFWFRGRGGQVQATIESISTPVLAATQVYRLSGAVLIFGYVAGQLPAHLAYTSGVIDIFIGLTAIPLALALRGSKPEFVAISWSTIGILDFVLAFTIVFVAMYEFASIEPDPTAIGRWPHSIISLFQVPLAIIIHAEILRRAFAKL
jgi:uncharacterized membrane protein YjfL (UPF0719 family)